MKKILFLFLCIVALSQSTEVNAQNNSKKDKKSKEKKEYVWDWNGERSGDKDFDEYLVKINELWKMMDTYQAKFGSYNYVEDTLQINGKLYIMAHMEDANKSVVTRGTVNWLFANSISTGVSIVLDATSASLLTTSATLALPLLGLKAVKFGKYLKGGPMVINKGVKDIGAMTKQTKLNLRSWRSLKNGAVDPETLNYFSEQALKTMKRCYYVKEIVKTAPTYTVIEQRLKDKTPAEIEAEANRIGQEIAQQMVLPEDANKDLDDLSDAELEELLKDL